MPFESTRWLAQYIIGTYLALCSWSLMHWANTAPRPGKRGPASKTSVHLVNSSRGKPPFKPLLGSLNSPKMTLCWLPEPCRPLTSPGHPSGDRLPWQHTPLPRKGTQTLPLRLRCPLMCKSPLKWGESAFSTLTCSIKELQGVRETPVGT